MCRSRRDSWNLAAERLNQRFRDGGPSRAPEEFGVLLHVRDWSEDPDRPRRSKSNVAPSGCAESCVPPCAVCGAGCCYYTCPSVFSVHVQSTGLKNTD